MKINDIKNKRLEMMITEPTRDTPILRKADVVVVGGGPAGLGAAIAASRNGADTILLERYGFLGGMSTAGYVVYWPVRNLAPAEGEDEALIGGIIHDFMAKLDDLGGCLRYDEGMKLLDIVNPELNNSYYSSYFPFSPEMMKIASLELIEEAGVTVLFHSLGVDVVLQDNQVMGVIIESKSGRYVILANVIIDATGDGDICVRAGAPFSNDCLMPVTMPIKMENIDESKAKEFLKTEPDFRKMMEKKYQNIERRSKNEEIDYSGLGRMSVRPGYKIPPEYPNKYSELRRSGEWSIERGAHFFCEDITNIWEITNAEITARKKVKEIITFIKENVPGFEKAYVSSTSPQIGIRESRHIKGQYELTRQDVLNGAKFDDVIARSRTFIGRRNVRGTWEAVFDIPYRCIVPQKIDGLLVAGRCASYSASAGTLFSPRDMNTCMAVGQAAGTAAALCTKMGVVPRKLDISILQRTLKSQGVNLGKDFD